LPISELKSAMVAVVRRKQSQLNHASRACTDPLKHAIADIVLISGVPLRYENTGS